MGAKSWLVLIIAGSATCAVADPAEVVGVNFNADGSNFSFSVTLRHGDTGWDDYADGWRVELMDGTILGTRILYHPHVNEQPFTRSLSGVEIPPGTKTVVVRAKTLPEGWAKSGTTVELQ